MGLWSVFRESMFDIERKTTVSSKRINRMLNLIAIVALSWLVVTLATVTLASGAQAAQMLPVESLLNADGTLSTSTGRSGALDLRGWSVTLDSARGPILSHDASAPAAPSANTWSALAHTGLNSSWVNAIAVSGSDLYVGGSFTQTADGTVTNLNHIAKYSGGAWSALANDGLNSYAVYALAVSGSDLYVGGYFTGTADSAATNLNHIAKYSGGAWSALANNGLNGYVEAFAMSGSDLYVGGYFTQTADSAVTNLGNIAKYSGGAWSALANNGLDSYVYALAASGSDLYVGGGFTGTADSAVTNLNYIAKYSGGAWSALADNGLNHTVVAIAVSGSDLYVGGAFTQTADSAVTNLNYIAKYSGGAWSALANNGLNGYVAALAVSGSDLYVGGRFTQTADSAVTNLNKIAKYSGSAWPVLANNGLNNIASALAVSGSDLYVGGAFTQTADGTVTNLNKIAKLGPGYTCYLPSVSK
jgi:trimeric autotransporter adhesin